MKDPRIKTLAHNLVNYSIALKKGEKVLIEAYEVPSELVVELVREVYKVGGLPYVETFDRKVQRALLTETSEEHLKAMAKYALCRMEDMLSLIHI